MKREIKKYNSFEEQELDFLLFFYNMTPSERLQSLAELQRDNFKDFLSIPSRKIICKKISNGYSKS